MGVSLNLQSAARYIHGTSPAALNGLYEVTHLKCKELGLAAWRPVAPEDSGGDHVGGNTRGIVQFVESVTKDSDKWAKRNLQQLYATLQARFAAAGHKSPVVEAEKVAAADKAKFDAAVKAEVDKQVAAKTAPKPVAPATVKPVAPLTVPTK